MAGSIGVQHGAFVLRWVSLMCQSCKTMTHSGKCLLSFKDESSVLFGGEEKQRPKQVTVFRHGDILDKKHSQSVPGESRPRGAAG